MTRTIVADLPSMSLADFTEFERTGGIWGQQRAIRRKQLYCALGFSTLLGTWSFYFTLFGRKNTKIVAFGVTALGFTFGSIMGNYLGTRLYPSVARNDETTMMRRLWWAQRCTDVEQRRK